VDVRVLGPEVRAAGLHDVSRAAHHDRRVPRVADAVDERTRGNSIDSAKVVREGEDRPVVARRTEVTVLGVGESTIVQELGADDRVLAGLEGGAVEL
jgi:hypothetical protein